MADGDWIDTKTAAALTGYDWTHISRLAALGLITAKKYGRDWMISKESLLAYQASKPQGTSKRGRKGR